MDLWEDCDRVILVDAVVTGKPAGTIVRWDASRQRVPREAFRFSTHTFGVADAVELAHMLEKLPHELVVYGIEGRHFQPGTGPGKRVLKAVERLAAEIANEVPECVSSPG
jgi:hydrogenase maturation protease